MKLRLTLTVASLILSILIGLVLANRGANQDANNSSSREKLLVGFSMDTLKEARWQKDKDYFVNQIETLGGTVLVQSANSDDTRQIQDVKALIAKQVDVLVIAPHNGQAMAEAVKLAKAANIPVLAYDRLITDCDLDAYISFDNFKVGEMQAQYLVDHLPTKGKGKIVRIYGSPLDNNAKLFKEGQDKVLKPYIDRGDIEVLHADWTTDWDPANAKKIMNAAITKYKTDFDAVLASNDGTAGGAIQALKEAGSTDKLITGQDADKVACQRIALGTQSMTIYKPIEKVARASADLAMDMARRKIIFANGKVSNGQKEVPSILLDVTAVDKENMRATVIKDGFQTEADVYGSSL
jgi:D-xylose transport system substrate-binding protein